jgi:predicted metal-dependent peptidase
MSSQQKTTNTSEKALNSAVQDTTTEAERSQALATALYEIRKEHTFYVSMLQSMNITYSHMLPTAGVTFKDDAKHFELYINPVFFIKALNAEQRNAVLLHEILHLVNRHLTRVPFMKISNHNRHLLNLAADLSINQYIKGLPSGCSMCPPKEAMQHGAQCPNDLCPGYALDINDWYDEDDKGNKKPWPKLETMEQYFLRLKERYKEDDEGSKDGDESGQGERKGGGQKGKGLPRKFDEHDWQAASDESEELEAMEDLVKRAMIKSPTSYENLPTSVKEMLQEIKTRRAELNYRALILSAIKKSASGSDTKYTWTRKSRRFGNIAPGTKEGPNPTLSFRIDTSGSISVDTANEFLSILDEFLKVGVRKCTIHLFSDSEYYSANYKVGDRLKADMIRKNVRMGGTCLEDSLTKILKRPSDLNIVFTDGYYSDIAIESKLKPGQRFPQCLFVIEKGGTENHPFANRPWQNTVKIPSK